MDLIYSAPANKLSNAYNAYNLTRYFICKLYFHPISFVNDEVELVRDSKLFRSIDWLKLEKVT